MRGAGMAAAYGAGLGVLSWLAFKAAAWVTDTAVGIWCRRQDMRQSKEISNG